MPLSKGRTLWLWKDTYVWQLLPLSLPISHFSNPSFVLFKFVHIPFKFCTSLLLGLHILFSYLLLHSYSRSPLILLLWIWSRSHLLLSPPFHLNLPPLYIFPCEGEVTPLHHVCLLERVTTLYNSSFFEDSQPFIISTL